MYPDILVATTRQGDDAAAFAYACHLAGSDGRVSVLVQPRLSTIPDGSLGAFAAAAYVAMYEQVQRDAIADRDSWTSVLADSGVAGEVKLVEDILGTPGQTAAACARYADIAVVGLDRPDTLGFEVHDEIASLLTGAGRPVLVVPRGHAGGLPARIVIGWQAGANAARAVHDALPLLEQAESVDIVLAGKDDDTGGDALARHLRRHGVEARVRLDPATGEPGATLLRQADELGADLLVMGGYGRSRLREWAFGGTTRHVLTHTRIPVLLAH
ncbi:universal stress protein [Arenimonas composti]|uniref:UspA domain-containing protein n=1 Tax=Arenimonas composti TR7-09 = DSM 18010 TaxID=1121013 RepID=A0A091B152_9GAMM|nr:universal stress protein [Arenimonas composti]KFN46323.1 hypothetical protein P873_02105 [Arenimonas composti TR7-09 = DSM 18010]